METNFDTKKVQKLKEALLFRKTLITELDTLDEYKAKVEKVRKDIEFHERI